MLGVTSTFLYAWLLFRRKSHKGPRCWEQTFLEYSEDTSTKQNWPWKLHVISVSLMTCMPCEPIVKGTFSSVGGDLFSLLYSRQPCSPLCNGKSFKPQSPYISWRLSGSNILISFEFKKVIGDLYIPWLFPGPISPPNIEHVATMPVMLHCYLDPIA